MFIHSTNRVPSHSLEAKGTQSTSDTTDKGPVDSVSLSSGDLKDVFVTTSIGAIPVLGYAANRAMCEAFSATGKPGLSLMSIGGAAANVGGTGMLVTGLLTGSHNYTKVGLALLGVSGVTSGAAAVAFRTAY